MIRAENLHKSFGKVVALRGAGFTALDGEITGLLGPNGAGKTTCLRILYTLLKPDQGNAWIDNIDIQSDPLEIQRRIGVLPESHGLYPRLTTRENIRYYGRLHGKEGPALESAIDRLISLLDMQDIENRRTEGFSSGQRVKVSIARALIHNPTTILLDEPTNGLDVMSTRAMRRFIRRFRDEGKCILFSSHIMQEVTALCDRIVIINGGQVVAAGSHEELLERYHAANMEDAFVAAIGLQEEAA